MKVINSMRFSEYLIKTVNIVRDKGLRTGIKAAKRNLMPREYVLFEQWWKYNRHYESEIDPYRVLYVNTNDIYDRNKVVVDPSKRYLSHVIGGDWDQEYPPFEDNLLYRSMKKHFVHGTPWKETQLYQEVIHGDEFWRGIEQKSEFKERTQYIDKLYNSIRKEGYKTQKALRGKNPARPMEVKVKIGRNGNYFYLNGKHRLSIAKILGIEQIPVNVTVRHVKWQNLREEIVNKRRIPEKLKLNPDHPDVEYLL